MAYNRIYERTYHAAYLGYIDAWWIYEIDGYSVRTIGYADTKQDIIKRAYEELFDIVFDD